MDRAKASELGLDVTNIARILRIAVHGTTATTIRSKGEDIDVVVKLALNSNYIDPHDTNRASIDEIRYLEIPTAKGGVLLGSILETSLEKSNAIIRHEDTKRVSSVTSQLEEGAIAGDVIKEFQAREAELALPLSVQIDYGGENDEINQSFKDMFRALIFGMIFVLAILILQFNSYRQALYIIVIVPFTLIGIFVGLAITGKTLSFPSIMGFIALSGIVVNNSIILIDTMNNLRRKNQLPMKEVVIEASTKRLRPILLTTITTVIGVIPLIFSSELWAPLAFSIIFGLSFAVVLTLILVPVLYNRWPGKLEGVDERREIGEYKPEN